MSRIVIVTGGASGIGRALSAALVRGGDTVVVADIDESAARAAVALMVGPGMARAAALDVTDDLHHLGLVGDIGVAALMDDRERRLEEVSPALGDPDPASIGGDNRDQVAISHGLGDVLHQQGQGEQVVDWSVEEALDLGGVEVDRHETVGTSSLEEVSDQSR